MNLKYLFIISAFSGIFTLKCDGMQSLCLRKDSAINRTTQTKNLNAKNIVDFSQDIPDDNDGNVKMDAADLFVGETQRNYPDYDSSGKYSIDFTISPCRKEHPKPVLFPTYYKVNLQNLKDPVLVKSSKLSMNDKIHLYELITNTKDQKYHDLLIDLVQNDTLQQDFEIRLNLIKCLGYYKDDSCKKVLLQLLDNKAATIATLAAICLVQINAFDEAINYFKNKYNSYDDYAEYVEYVYSALIYVNNKESIELLKKFLKIQNNPGYTLDGLAALSLIGECDYAYLGFKSLINCGLEKVREKTVSCLAYYIGTPEAINIINTLTNDESVIVRSEVEHVLKLYYNQSKK